MRSASDASTATPDQAEANPSRAAVEASRRSRVHSGIPAHRADARRWASSQPSPVPTQPAPVPTDGSGEIGPGGDVLTQIMRELAKAIEEGRLKPIVVGPVEIDIPGQGKPSGPGQPQTPGGDILGQILRDLLSGKSSQAQLAGLKNGAGVAVFGDRLESGQNIKQDQLDSLQQVFDRFLERIRSLA